MKNVLVNVSFRDTYTNEVREAGKTYPMTEERVKEIKEVNPNFVTVVGNIEEESSDSKTKSGTKKGARNTAKGKGKDVKAEGTQDDEAEVEDVEVEDVDVDDVDTDEAAEVPTEE